jgi:hypothetical protein
LSTYSRHSSICKNMFRGTSMAEIQDFPSLAKRRRGVAPGTFLIWILLAAVGGAVMWAIFGNDVRSTLRLPPASAHWAVSNQNQTTATNLNELMAMVKDLQAAQTRAADEVRLNLQLLTSEQAATQAATKIVSDAVTALQVRVGELQSSTATAAKIAPAAPRKPPVAARPAAEPAQPDLEPPPGAPTRIVPR